MTAPIVPVPRSPLPADDPGLFELDLPGLRRRWRDAASRAPIGAEAMTGADLRARAMGIPAERLMEHAGTAVAAAVHAVAVSTGRWGSGPILILAGSGNNGGDGFVAARHLASAGTAVTVVLVGAARPKSLDAARNWDRLDGEARVDRVVCRTGRDLAFLTRNIDTAAIAIDALLGTGVRGPLREPIRDAVEVLLAARRAAVPIVAVDTPTAVDLSSGDASEPVVAADLTVTFHRPKTGLLAARGARLAGRVLVAPIGIPLEADRG